MKLLALLFWLILPMVGAAEAATAPVETASRDPLEQTPLEDILKLRDPFKRPEVELGKGVPRTELEYYNLDAFKMIAVLTGPSKLRAMLRTPDGRTYLVQSGMKIGTRNGVIQKITDEAVRVRERIVNVLGREENVDTEIPLQADPRGSGLVIKEQ